MFGLGRRPSKKKPGKIRDEIRRYLTSPDARIFKVTVFVDDPDPAPPRGGLASCDVLVYVLDEAGERLSWKGTVKYRVSGDGRLRLTGTPRDWASRPILRAIEGSEFGFPGRIVEGWLRNGPGLYNFEVETGELPD